MSKIQAIPFIQKVIATLSTEEQASLAALINGSDTEPSFKSLINPIYKITSEDEGVSYCTLETQDKTFTGYLLYTDTYCVFIAFAQDTQSLSVLNINLTNQTYKFVEESLTILELRFSLEEIKEPTDIMGTVQSAIDSGAIDVKAIENIEDTGVSDGSVVKMIGFDSEGNLVQGEVSEGQVVDQVLDSTSTNAVGNAPVTTAIEGLQSDISDIETALDTKANTNDLLDGTLIPNKALQAKSIEAVSTESGAVQDTPFIYQGTGTANGTSIADTSPVGKHLEKQGNSVVVNQLIQTLVESGVGIGLTVVNNGNGTLTISGTPTNNALTIVATNGSAPAVVGHKLLIIGGTQKVGIRGAYDLTHIDYGNGIIIDALNANEPQLAIVLPNLNAIDPPVTIRPQCIDLTQWFGGDIPQDLLDHPENFFRYYNGSLAYNAGTLKNSDGRYLVCTGRQLWDEEWELGSISGTTGNNVSSSNAIRSKGYIEVIPNRAIYTRDGMGGLAVFAYDKDKHFVGLVGVKHNTYFTTDASTRYLRFYATGASYNRSITISLYYETGDSYDQYFPYEEPKVYDTGSETLLSAGSVKDVKAPDGTITRNIISVDLSELSWTPNGTYSNTFNGALTNLAKVTSTPSIFNAICSKYEQFTSTEVGTKDKGFALGTGGNVIYVRDTSINSASEIAGILNYELEEPTTEQGTPFAENIEINDYGTMAWDSEVPQGCKIFYPADYALFIDSVGQRQDINWDALAIVSHTELNNETDALEAKDTQLLNALGGTLRQLLAVSKSIDFDNTDFVDLGTLSWAYDSSNNLFYVALPSAKKSDSNTTAFNGLCTKYKVTALQGVTGTRLSGLAPSMDYLIAVDSSFATDATAFKAAMKGVLLAYEKAE